MSKHTVITFGRMNPPTVGHQQVVNKVLNVAKEVGGDHHIILSATQDKVKNPLDVATKVKHASNAFPNAKIVGSSKQKPTILHHLSDLYDSGTTDAHIVVGSDRYNEMKELTNKYNGTNSRHGHYNFNSITVHSAGERDPDSDDVSGMSATKMRELARNGSESEFYKGLPSEMKPEHKTALYNDLKDSMKLNESYIILYEGFKTFLKTRGGFYG